MWNRPQAFIFSGLFWGATVSVLLSGFAADRYGPKYFLLLGAVVGGVGNLLTPLTATRGGSIGLFILRFIIGLGWGLLYPCVSAFIAKWVPPNEKSSAVAIYTGGTQLGFITCFPLFAFLCTQKQFLAGWPAIFYVSGVVPIAWCGLWLLFSTNSPAKNRFISQEEVDYIQTAVLAKNSADRKKATNETPWLKMATSTVLWSDVLAYFSGTFFVGTMQTYMPTYFKDVLKLDLKNNGLYTILPYLSQWVSKFILSTAADALKRKTSIPHTRICKIFNSIGSFGCASALVGLSFIDCGHPQVALVLLATVFFCYGSFVPGFRTSIVSIAPPLQWPRDLHLQVLK